MVKRNQHGRGIIEMLGVLAVIGLLTLVILFNFRHTNAKKVANTIINDSRVVFLDAKSDEELTDDWQESSHISETGIDFMVMRDVQGNDYVMALNVEMEVCQQMLKMTSPNLLSFFNEDETEMMFCNPINNIIIAWDGAGKPAECETNQDCEDGLCDEDGYCQSCDESSERLSSDGTFCECDPNKALTCEDREGNFWCCGSGLVCDMENQSCKESTGLCQYTFTQQEQAVKANCSYLISEQKQTKKANCHFTVKDVIVDGDLHKIEIKKIKGCPTNEYCYISQLDENCETSLNRANIGASKTEDVYGVCLPRSLSGGDCNLAVASTSFMQKGKQCASDEYCYIGYLNEDCSTAINRADLGAKQNEEVFGVCLKRTLSGGTCNVSEIISGGAKLEQRCPVGQYCLLKWTQKDCSSTISSSSITGSLFGVCTDLTSNTAQCPIK